MLILYESPAGYGLFKLLDESRLSNVDNIYKEFQNTSSLNNFIHLLDFQKYNDMQEALDATEALQNGETLHQTLIKFIQNSVIKKKHNESLAVADVKIGGLLKEKFSNLNVINNNAVQELMKGLRGHFIQLFGELTEQEEFGMKLGLSHALCRHKLQFSAEKVDTMIVQAIALLDELDKEINVYAMRVKEWYGWHFPEMARTINDNMLYCRIIKKVGMRYDAEHQDLSDLLNEEQEVQLKNIAKISMGSDITQEDLVNIRSLCDQVLELSEYRSSLYEYLRNRMNAIAPNLTVMVGELVGARLLAHAGSLVNLAKYPASTVQILGAEKALFRALKSHSTSTPKYGLIYHAQFVNAASSGNKAKIARTLACKTALSTRVDAFTLQQRGPNVGFDHFTKMERRLNTVEGRQVVLKTKALAGAITSKHEYATDHPKYEESGDIIINKENRENKEEKEDIDMEDNLKQSKSKKRKLEEAEAPDSKKTKTEESDSKTEETDKEAKKRRKEEKRLRKEKKKQEKLLKKQEKEQEEESQDAPELEETTEQQEKESKKSKKKDKKKKDKKKKKEDKDKEKDSDSD